MEPLTGRCACGTVRFEVTEPPIGASWCHCTRCQRRTGTSASAGAALAPGSFRFTAGEDAVRAWEPDSGFSKHFCGLCGGALFSRDPHDHDRVSVRMSAFDSDPGVRPGYRQFVAYAASWDPIPDDGLPRYPEGRPAQASSA